MKTFVESQFEVIYVYEFTNFKKKGILMKTFFEPQIEVM